MTGEATDYWAEIKRFVSLFAKVSDDANYCEARLASIAGELQDIFHGIEFVDDVDDDTMRRCYMRIRELRRERRRLKDEQMLLKPFLGWAAKNEAVANGLARVQGEIRQVREALDNRQYVKRRDDGEDEGE